MGKSRNAIYGFVLLSGMAALVWEVLWQVKASLSLGISAWGTALTLAITMGGMSVGALTMGHILKNRTIQRPERIYAVLEWTIGLSGLLLTTLFHVSEQLDGWLYPQFPSSAVAVYVLGIVMAIGVPTMAMGATLPVLGLISQRWQTSIAVIYGLNTLGAAIGTLLAAFFFIPAFGLTHTIWIISGLNMVVGVLAWLFGNRAAEPVTQATAEKKSSLQSLPFRRAMVVVFVTGFATFLLEVAWFRSLRAAFMSTTDAFAIMLSCVLIALGTGPSLIPALKKTKSLGPLLVWAGILILLMTPVIERFDLFIPIDSDSPVTLFARWFFLTLWVVGLPVLLLGIALPWLLDEQDNPRQWSLLYGINTSAAILGALGAGWILLPAIGFAKTAWIAGAVVSVTGLWIAASAQRIKLAVLSAVALAIAVCAYSGARIQGAYRFNPAEQPKVLQSYEGPDVSIAVAAYENDSRLLFIDGFIATQHATTGFMRDHIHYMAWMGHLPMAAHPDPEHALVICFGTGQTANAVRKENPETLDLVDVNAKVFKLAEYFPSNEKVLEDKRVTPTVMDGRSYLRRNPKSYDVITLEPMPPNFAGVNALYSREFYALARSRLTEHGTIAQWLPFHLVTPDGAASIAKTFQNVFPNSILWIDPVSKTGILLGSKDDAGDLGKSWPGYKRPEKRDLSESDVRKAVLLDRKKLEEYGKEGTVITDDNQYLSYGKATVMIRDNTVRGHHSIVDAPR